MIESCESKYLRAEILNPSRKNLNFAGLNQVMGLSRKRSNSKQVSTWSAVPPSQQAWLREDLLALLPETLL